MPNLEIDVNGLVYSGMTLPNAGTEPPLEEIDVCRRWLQLHGVHRRRMKAHNCSYAYKCRIEVWSGRPISNGAVIAAARELGFRVKPSHRGALDALFNMTLQPCCKSCTALTLMGGCRLGCSPRDRRGRSVERPLET